MKPGFFIDRPVFSTVLSILIVIVGIIGLALLPVDQYPQITPPVVKISATYPGASALTVSQAVATPIEQELNGTPGMIYMQSSSSNSGSLNITVTFDVSADADLAAVEIQNRVKLAESRLPAEVIQNGITIEKQAPSQLMTLSLMSDDPQLDVMRKIFSRGDFVEEDKQGRITLPSYLLEYGGITKNVISIGVRDRVELWAEDVWQAYDSSINLDDIFKSVGTSAAN